MRFVRRTACAPFGHFEKARHSTLRRAGKEPSACPQPHRAAVPAGPASYTAVGPAPAGTPCARSERRAARQAFPAGQAKRRLSGVGRADCAVFNGSVALHKDMLQKVGAQAVAASGRGLPYRDALRPFREARRPAGIPGRAGKTPPFRRGPRGLRCVQRACSFTQGYGPKGGHTGHRSLRAGLASPGRAPPIQRDTGRAAVQRALPCASRTAVYGTRCGDCSMPLRGLPMQQYGSGTPPGGHSRRDRQSLPCRIAPHIPTLPGAGCRQRKARVQRARKLYGAPKCAILY